MLLVLVGPAPDGTGWGPASFVIALDAVGAGGAWTLVVTVGATAAAAGSLLALVAGLGVVAAGLLVRRLARPGSE